MQNVTEKPSSRRRGRPPAAAEGHDEPPQELRDRLSELLPEEALQDALKGLAPEEITGAGGLMNQLADRVIDAALRADRPSRLSAGSGTPWRERESSQRRDCEDRPERPRACRGEHAARSPGQLCAAAGGQAPDAAGGPGREDPLALCRRDVSPGYLRASLRSLLGADRARHGQPRHRRRPGGHRRVAHPSVGCPLPDRVFRRDHGQGHRGPQRQDPGVLSRGRGHAGGRARAAGPVVAGHRGRQVLAGRAQRPASPRRLRRADRLRRRPRRLPGGDRRCLPRNVGSDVHRALCRPGGYADSGC